MLFGGLVSDAIFERWDWEKCRENRPNKGLRGLKIPMLTLERKKCGYGSTIASSRITMEKQLLRKASYLMRNYYFPAYLIVAGIPIFNVGSCKRVELVVLLEILTFASEVSKVTLPYYLLLVHLPSCSINLNYPGDLCQVGFAC